MPVVPAVCVGLAAGTVPDLGPKQWGSGTAEAVTNGESAQAAGTTGPSNPHSAHTRRHGSVWALCGDYWYVALGTSDQRAARGSGYAGDTQSFIRGW